MNLHISRSSKAQSSLILADILDKFTKLCAAKLIATYVIFQTLATPNFRRLRYILIADHLPSHLLLVEL